MNHLTDDQLVLNYYGEAADCDAPDHLAGCGDCRSRYAALQRILNVVDGAPAPERPLDYGSEVWARIAPCLPQPRRRRWFQFVWWPKLAVAGAMGAMLLVAFLAGRWSGPELRAPDEVAETGAESGSPMRRRVLTIAVGGHLERSQMMLAELTNAPAYQGALDISGEREMAEELLGDNRLYRMTAASSGDQKLAAVLDDLERLLIEIAHSPSELPAEQLKEIRSRMDSQNLLFKVRSLGAKLRSPERMVRATESFEKEEY